MKYLVIIIFVIMVIFVHYVLFLNACILLIDSFIFQFLDIFIITYLPCKIYINIKQKIVYLISKI